MTEGKRKPFLASFGRRKNRVLGAQNQERMDSVLPKFSISLETNGALDPAGLFNFVPRAVWLEIGFGGGEHLANMALVHKDTGFIGCEPFINGIAKLLEQMADGTHENIRIFNDDARLLMQELPDASIEKVFILYPDPWPKIRHHKRRIISAALLNELARIITPGGGVQIASDHGDYLVWIFQHFMANPSFVWQAETKADWETPPEHWVKTRYEQKNLAEASRPTYLYFIRR